MDYEKKNLEDTVVPSSVLTYLDPLYWNDRFAKEEHYEWLKYYSHFRHLILENIQPNSSVLELGCGNSQLSDEMYKNGIKNITCTDLSPIVVEKVQKRLLLKEFKEIKAMVANMLDLPFADDSFDVVIEKGTMDVLFVDSGDSWNPKAETISKVMAMPQGIHRVLKPNGIYISISFGQPHFRRPLFEAPDFTWSMKWSTFGDGFHYFFYTLKKGTRSLNSYQPCERLNLPPICLYQDELEGEDFLFRTNIDESEDN
ncbi:methyltransferase-like protein 13 [Chenopodium quinoa]|uniref:methyltransferase-like protein 13 n=1 Tax=Chenopodium quinoa TaxID=63459 RepID=UPI000B784A33|nr:methyltransferase-like protein 13 [Chenopodium quinoa]